MKQLIEFIPIALFGGVYFWTRDIFAATFFLMGGICLQLAFEYWTTRKVSRQTQIIFWSAILLGGATVIFRNEEFLFWKPTIVNWIFSLALLGFHFFSKENLLRRMLGSKIQLPEHVWINLSLGWAMGFFLAGLLNLIVAFQFSLDFWVSYKLFGGLGLTLFYFVVMAVYLARGGYLNQPKPVTEETINR
ncbi:MAG TPA: inner membrane-spanning protein YciB [SAR324 cluster bacterium]|nr:inner membrane-spanning protein YciB [SAR324 cluster bacterium]